MKKNEIVVYQPDASLRLNVNVENDTVWLTQSQMVRKCFAFTKLDAAEIAGLKARV